MTAALTPGAINSRWTEAFNAGDVPALLELYEPDAVLVPGPDAPPVSGLAAIEASLQWLVGLYGRITFEPHYWLQQGDLAMGRIDFQLTGGTDSDGSPVHLHGSAAEVARRQPDGSWKCVFDHPFGATQA